MSNEGVSPRYIIGVCLAAIPIHTVGSDRGLFWIGNLLVETQDTYDNYATITPQTGMSREAQIESSFRAERSEDPESREVDIQCVTGFPAVVVRTRTPWNSRCDRLGGLHIVHR